MVGMMPSQFLESEIQPLMLQYASKDAEHVPMSSETYC